MAMGDARVFIALLTSPDAHDGMGVALAAYRRFPGVHWALYGVHFPALVVYVHQSVGSGVGRGGL